MKKSKKARGGPKVWDLPTRIFHWSLVLLVFASFMSAEFETTDTLFLHRAFGTLIAGLLVFRLVWGFLGNRQAQFKNFPLGPRGFRDDFKALFLSRRKLPRVRGHASVGAWASLAILLILFLQVASGLATSDDSSLAAGPLAYRVPEVVSALAVNFHHFAENIIIAVIALHVAAVAWHHLGKKHRILGAMITGRGHREEGEAETEEGQADDEPERPLRALVAAGAGALVVGILYALY